MSAMTQSTQGGATTATQKKWSDVDIKSWAWKDAKVINPRTQQIQVYIDSSPTDRARPTIQLERMTTPWGFELDEGETLAQVLADGEKAKLRIKFNISSPEFGAWVASLDELTLNKALEKKWWPKEPTDDKICSDHKPIYIKDKSDGRYPPKVKVRVNISGPRPTKVFVAEGTTYREGKITDIVAGVEAVPIVEVAGVWASGVGFGIDLLATKMLVYLRIDATPDFSFVLDAPLTHQSVASKDSNGPSDDVDDDDSLAPSDGKMAKTTPAVSTDTSS